MASKEQKEEAKKLCREFLEVNKKLGLHKGDVSTFYNHKKRRQLIRHGTKEGRMGSATKLLPLEEAKRKLNENTNT